MIVSSDASADDPTATIAATHGRGRHGGWRGQIRGVRRSRSGLIGLVIVVVVVLMALVPAVFAPRDPNRQTLLQILKPPSPASLMGTDQLGRDILSRVVYGARVSVAIGLSATIFASLAGVTCGLLAGYFGGIIDDALMRLADVQLAFPFLLLAIAIIGVLGASLLNLIIVLGIANWVVYARVVRSEVLSVRSREFVTAARCTGASTTRILARHVLPNIVPSVIVIATFGVANAIIAEAGLSFLGMGVPPEIPSWGGMLADGRARIDTAWWQAFFPGVAILITVLGINLLGDHLRDVLDPYTQSRGST
jgi:peptide/nickel transport system permease protein